MKKIKAITRFQIALLLSNKTAFIYTLVFPIGYLVYMLTATKFAYTQTTDVVTFLSPYWAYIIVGSVLNGWVSNIISTRENNFLKVYTSIVGDKRYIFFANFLVASLSSFTQILLFDILFFGMTRSLNLTVFTLSVVVAIVANILVTLGSIAFLKLRVPIATVTIYLTGYLLLGLLLVNVQSTNLLTKILLNLFDAYYFVTTLAINLGSVMTSGQFTSVADLIALVITSISYVLIGVVLLDKVSVSSRFSRA